MRLVVRVTPRASAEKIDRIAGGRLKIWLTAPPADNQANEALLRLLAREWWLPRRDLSIAAGGKSRDKIVRIVGDPVTLMARLTMLIVEHSV